MTGYPRHIGSCSRTQPQVVQAPFQTSGWHLTVSPRFRAIYKSSEGVGSCLTLLLFKTGMATDGWERSGVELTVENS